jgi:hypothetical protein
MLQSTPRTSADHTCSSHPSSVCGSAAPANGAEPFVPNSRALATADARGSLMHRVPRPFYT